MSKGELLVGFGCGGTVDWSLVISITGWYLCTRCFGTGTADWYLVHVALALVLSTGTWYMSLWHWY